VLAIRTHAGARVDYTKVSVGTSVADRDADR
jgi:hypothetical protein